MHIWTIIIVCYSPPAGFGEIFNRSPRTTKNRIIQKNMPLRTTTQRTNPLNMYPQISQILDETSSTFTSPHVIEGP